MCQPRELNGVPAEMTVVEEVLLLGGRVVGAMGAWLSRERDQIAHTPRRTPPIPAGPRRSGHFVPYTCTHTPPPWLLAS